MKQKTNSNKANRTTTSCSPPFSLFENNQRNLSFSGFHSSYNAEEEVKCVNSFCLQNSAYFSSSNFGNYSSLDVPSRKNGKSNSKIIRPLLLISSEQY